MRIGIGLPAAVPGADMAALGRWATESERAARHGQGWVAPLFGMAVLREGAAAVHQAWQEAGRAGRPRIVTGRYFGLGTDADAIADDYLRHYYGDAYSAVALADTLTTTERVDELSALREAGTTDLVLYPTSGGLEQVDLLAGALHQTGYFPTSHEKGQS